jgi:hypothetical protein
MDIFTQKRLLIRIVILLIFLNLTLITVLMLRNFIREEEPFNPSPENRDVSAVLKRELKLTDDQVEAIRELRKKYFEKEKFLENEIKMERDSINSYMFRSNPDSVIIKSLARRVANNEYRMEMLRFRQAEELIEICTAEQLAKFEGIILEIRDFFRKDNPPKANQKRKPEGQNKMEPRTKREKKPR